MSERLLKLAGRIRGELDDLGRVVNWHQVILQQMAAEGFESATQ